MIDEFLKTYNKLLSPLCIKIVYPVNINAISE